MEEMCEEGGGGGRLVADKSIPKGSLSQSINQPTNQSVNKLIQPNNNM